MDSLSTGLVAQTLQRLFTEAEQADRALMEQYSNAENPDQLAEDFAEHFAEERRDVRGFYRGYVDNFLNVTPEYGRFLYQCARARKATDHRVRHIDGNLDHLSGCGAARHGRW